MISGTWVLILDLLRRWFFLFIYWGTHCNVPRPDSVHSLVLSHFLKHSPYFLCLLLEYLGRFLFVFFLFCVWFLPLTNSESRVMLVTCLGGSRCCLIVIALMLEELTWERRQRFRHVSTSPVQSVSCSGRGSFSVWWYSFCMSLCHCSTWQGEWRLPGKPQASQDPNSSQISSASAPKPAFVCLC